MRIAVVIYHALQEKLDLSNWKSMKRIKYILKSGISVLKTKNIIPITNVVEEEKILEGKTALILGGNGGIGFSIAKKFMDSGCKVIIAGSKEEKLKKCCEDLGGASYIIIDMRDVSVFEQKIAGVFEKYKQLDILVNSAGIHLTRPFGDFLNITEEEYDSIMGINLKGMYFMCQAVAKQMIERKIRGHILNISSQSALEPAWSPYRLSKRGVKAITEGLAQSLLPYGIIVNGIAPGPTATGMQNYEKGDSIYTDSNPTGRYVMPEEVAEYAKMLVSDLGNMVIGDTVYISGGRGIIDVR